MPSTMSGSPSGAITPLLLADFLPEHDVVLLQVVMETKENESPAAVHVVQLLEMPGKIVTAMRS